MAVRLSALRSGRLLSSGRFRLLISVRSWVDPRTIMRVAGKIKSLSQVNACHLASRWSLVWLIFRPWIWRRHVPQKRQLTFNVLRLVIGLSQKAEPFITTAVRISKPTSIYFFMQVSFFINVFEVDLIHIGKYYFSEIIIFVWTGTQRYGQHWYKYWIIYQKLEAYNLQFAISAISQNILSGTQ
jgi:hypothetical protein